MGATQSMEKVEHVAKKGYAFYQKINHELNQPSQSYPPSNSSPIIPPESSEDDQYANYRALAGEEAQKRNDCFGRSKIAYSSGNGAEAKQLSNQGKHHDSLMRQYNEQAAQYIYEKNNNGRAYNEIDLHGLYVKEASRKVEEAIQRCQKQRADHLTIIVGKGLHSPGQIAKLKPAIIQLVEKYEVSCQPNIPNPGCLYIEFGVGKGDLSWLDRITDRMSNDGCNIM